MSINLCRYSHLNYRTLEGFCRNLSKILGIPTPDHSTIHRRFLKMDFIPPAITSEEIIIAVDSSGIKVHKRGEWMREKYKKRRGWIKIHRIDVETKQITLRLRMNKHTTTKNSRISLRNLAKKPR